MTQSSPILSVSHVKSTDDIRADFPALGREHRGRPVAYFDGPGGTQVPRVVIDAVAEYLATHNANTHWGYPTSNETDAVIESSRDAMAMLLNASPDEIAFGQNMTTLTFHLSRALGRRFAPGDTIVVTDLDHHANIDPWCELARDRGLRVARVPFSVDRGRLDWSALERALEQGPCLLAIGAASNALGTITDVRAAARLAHDAGALVFVDAVHYVPHELPDVRAIECDFLACSAYKFYGPHLGVLFGKRDILLDLDVPKLVPAPNGPADRLETGTQNHEGIAGAGAAVRYLASLAPGRAARDALQAVYGAFHERGVALARRLWEGLSAVKGVRLYGVPPSSPRTPTVAFTIDRIASAEVSRRLAEDAIFASHGDFYAMTVVERLGLAHDGLVRAGCACYTTAEEVERLIAAVERIARG